MTTWIALLRAVNVGGTGKLAMPDLRALCVAAGFGDVRTYIASGNVVFTASGPEARIKARIETALADHAGRPIPVMVRSAADMAAVLDNTPFPDARPSHTMAVFLDAPPPPDALATARRRTDEEIAPGLREIYVHYPSGMGRSKLRIPAAEPGTARNMNTVAALCRMAGYAS